MTTYTENSRYCNAIGCSMTPTKVIISMMKNALANMKLQRKFGNTQAAIGGWCTSRPDYSGC